MDRKYVGIFIIILALAIIAGIVYVIFFYRFTPTSEETPEVTTDQTKTTQTSAPQATTTQETTVKVSHVKKTTVNEEDLKRIAAAFVERFGSYSNQSDYGNVRDLKIFMSTSMQNWADSYISQLKAKSATTAIYYGITTKAVAVETRQYDSDTGQAEFVVGTQRREASGATANATTFNQNIVIKFIKEAGAWKVDAAYWQSR